MTVSKKMCRAAIVTIAVTSSGCATGGLSSVNLNPFSKTAEAEVVESDTAKVALAKATAPTTAPVEQKPSGFTTMMKRTGQVLGTAFRFGRSAEKPEDDIKNDPLAIVNKPDKLGTEVYVANGQLWESNGSFDRAMDNYSKALEVDPENAHALGAIARMHERQNLLESSIEHFTRAIASNPSDSSLYADLGLVYARQERYAEAVEQIQKAMAISPANKKYANHLATIYMDAGNSDAALATLTKAHAPAVARYNMAYLHFKRQQLTEARDELQLALKIDPNLGPARTLLDKLGGTQIAQVSKETITAAGDTAAKIGNVGKAVSETYEALTGQSAPVSRSLSSKPAAPETETKPATGNSEVSEAEQTKPDAAATGTFTLPPTTPAE